MWLQRSNEYMFVALIIQHAMHMLFIAKCGLSSYDFQEKGYRT